MQPKRTRIFALLLFSVPVLAMAVFERVRTDADSDGGGPCCFIGFVGLGILLLALVVTSPERPERYRGFEVLTPSTGRKKTPPLPPSKSTSMPEDPTDP